MIFSAKTRNRTDGWFLFGNPKHSLAKVYFWEICCNWQRRADKMKWHPHIYLLCKKRHCGRALRCLELFHLDGSQTAVRWFDGCYLFSIIANLSLSAVTQIKRNSAKPKSVHSISAKLQPKDIFIRKLIVQLCLAIAAIAFNQTKL